MLANKFDGDCFALVGAHQHGITIHNQDLMRERESGVISFIIYYYGGGGGWGWGRGSWEILKFYCLFYKDGGEELCMWEVHPLCSLSSSVSILIN